jgi:hypothetical protein
MREDDYKNKIANFINNNNFTKLPRHITNKRQPNTRSNINNSKNIINSNNKWKYINVNLSALHICETIKLHKENPIHPDINWRESPGYIIAKYPNIIKNNTLQLPNTFNVQNTNMLTQSLKNLNK